jgi:hypothetical protein
MNRSEAAISILQVYRAQIDRGSFMKKTKSSISKSRSYAALGEYWDQHDLSGAWERVRK